MADTLRWTFSSIDITAGQNGIPESDAIPLGYNKSAKHAWVTRVGPDKLDWSITKTGDAVRIPVLPYVTYNKDPSSVTSLAFQLGADSVAALNNVFDKQTIEIIEGHITIGEPVEELEDYEVNGRKIDCFRFWLGFAVRIKLLS